MTDRRIDPLELDHLIETWLSSGLRFFHVKKQPDAEGARAASNILDLGKQDQLEALRRLATAMAEIHKARFDEKTGSIANRRSKSAQELFAALSRRKLPCTQQDLIHILGCINRMDNLNARSAPLTSVLTVVERGLEHEESGSLFEHLLGDLRSRLVNTGFAEERALVARIDRLLESDVASIIDGRDVWARAVLDRLAEMTDADRGRWQSLVTHAGSAPSAKPPKGWLARASELVNAIGREVFVAEVISWFRLVGFKGTGSRGEASHDARLLLQGRNAEVLRGLVCCCTGIANAELATALGELGATCYGRVRGHGRFSVGVGNACTVVLASMPGTEPITQLSRLRHRAKMPNVERMIDKDLDRLAGAAGLTTAELEDLAVPTLGMETVGELRRKLGDHTAVVRVRGTSTTYLRWIGLDGAELESVPTPVKRDHPDELRELKTLARRISTQLLIQRDRLESTYLAKPRVWPFDAWRDRLLDHPLLGSISRRLIWRFTWPAGETADGAWNDGAIVAADGEPIHGFGSGAGVGLWHPICAGDDEIQRWRRWTEEHSIRQPFKQAHREVYTSGRDDGPDNLRSDRFAGKSIRQHQLMHLARSRGWRAERHGVGKSNPVPTLLLPHWGMRAELEVHGFYHDHDDVTSARDFLTMTTGAVRFLDSASGPIGLDEVPAVVFSEVMRHVDLFVSVCGGDDETATSDGEINATVYSLTGDRFRASGRTRRDFLEALIPQVSTADRCSFSEQFLEVEGERAVYRIHLGSGAVLVGPRWRFLRFQSDKAALSAADTVLEGWTPPPDDDELVQLIVGRALLLADDRAIRDSHLLQQIHQI